MKSTLKEEYKLYVKEDRVLLPEKLDLTRLSVCNDAIRPIYGPSSSHTYASARIADHARQCFGNFEGVANVTVLFFGGDEMAFKGHASDRAVIGGILGLSPYNDAFEQAKQLNLKIIGDKVLVDGYVGISFEFYFDKDYKAHEAAFGMLIIIADERKELRLLSRSIGGGNIAIDRIEGRPAERLPNLLRAVTQPGWPVTPEGIQALEGSEYDVMTLEDLAKLAEKKKTTIAEIVLEREELLLQTKKAEVLDFMRQNWNLMKKNMDEGLKGETFGELTEEVAKKLPTFVRSSPYKFRDLSGRAMAVVLVGTSIGRIVSCPTAGAAGIVPAVAYDIFKETPNEISEDDIINSLFTAGMICLVIKAKVSVSGAQHGCQAECGTGRAMAAGLETELKGGSPGAVINSVARAMIESFGLTCDPMAGLVEIPCVARNAACAVAARYDAAMSLANFDTINPEEVLKVMDEVGGDMSDKYKENKIGLFGLAGTPTAMRIMEKLKTTSNRYRIPYKVAKLFVVT